MKKIIAAALAAFLLLALTSCFNSNSFSHHAFFAMDTYITVDIKNANPELLKEAEEMVYRDEQRFSRTFAGSEVYELNKSGSAEVSKETAELIELSLKLSSKTNGAFNPCMGALTELWNIKSEAPRVPDASEIRSALSKCSTQAVAVQGSLITLSGGTILDLGGVAKGYSAENLIRHLKENGITDALVGFGGSIACIGAPAKGERWKIGIRNPFDTSDIIGSIAVSECYIAVSGAYERFFERDGKRYHHIIDPESGYPAQSDIESSVVIAGSGALADALSTALFVMGSDKALEFYKSGIYDFEAVLIKTSGEIIVTDGLCDSFEQNKDAVYGNSVYK